MSKSVLSILSAGFWNGACLCFVFNAAAILLPGLCFLFYLFSSGIDVKITLYCFAPIFCNPFVQVCHIELSIFRR